LTTSWWRKCREERRRHDAWTVPCGWQSPGSVRCSDARSSSILR
jgi:hypothetical protein